MPNSLCVSKFFRNSKIFVLLLLNWLAVVGSLSELDSTNFLFIILTEAAVSIKAQILYLNNSGTCIFVNILPSFLLLVWSILFCYFMMDMLAMGVLLFCIAFNTET
jgi:hypothetical protein